MLFSLLDEHIVEGIPAERIQGYEHEVSTHAQVAQDVANGEADAEYKSPRLALVLDYVHTSAFRKTLRTLGDTTQVKRVKISTYKEVKNG